jgi:uncharacterized protein with gpF-like domain
MNEDFSHKFLMCLPKKFKTLRTNIFRGGLIGVSPNEILGDIITDAQYNDSDNEDEEKKDKKDDDKKKKSVAFKASTSSKSRGKAKKEASSEDEDASDIDDEAMALLVHKIGKFKKKRGYGTREEIT